MKHGPTRTRRKADDHGIAPAGKSTLGRGMSCGCCRRVVYMDERGVIRWTCRCQSRPERCILCRRCGDCCRCGQKTSERGRGRPSALESYRRDQRGA